MVKPRGPYHSPTCFGSVHTSKTSVRGASRTREITISRSDDAVTGLFFRSATPFLLRLQFVQIVVQAIQALLPMAAVIRNPIGDLLERCRLQTAGAPLGLAPARNQAGTLQHLEMLGNPGKTHLERCGQLS